MGPNIQHSHARSENALDETSLPFFETVGEHRLSAEIVSGEPPSDIGYTDRHRISGNVPQPTKKHSTTLFLCRLVQESTKPTESPWFWICGGTRFLSSHMTFGN
jgi:hypothetical protein